MKVFKITLLIILLSVASALHAKSNDTLHVVTHNKLTVVTDPSTGFKLYKKWGVFPSENFPIRKIVMHIKFACPDSMRCADWDYMDPIRILRKGGVNGAVQNFELSRMLTPYGGAFGKNWKFEWEVDVTDFSSLLRDSVEIEYKHNGYEPNHDRGWAVTIDFEIIKGKAAFVPISIQKIYDDAYSYGDNKMPIDQLLKPVTFTADTKTSLARLRVIQTGHGMDKPDGCAEFCNKYRYLYYDGKLIDTKSIWKKCGDNPLYPQAGTWIIDRANWCPGNLMQPDIYDFAIQSSTEHTVKLKMQNYVSIEPSAKEVISAYLIQYKKANIKNDVTIEDIIAPSSKAIYSRQNPIAANAEILVKNVGSNVVKSLLIQYRTIGFTKNKHQWVGTLAPGKTLNISLPGLINSNLGKNQFEVEILKINGNNDGFVQDNKLAVSFTPAPVHNGDLVFHLLTNNQPGQNSYLLKNSDGKVVQERKLGTLKANTIYNDTLHLAAGAYSLELIDTAGDGLEFWYNAKAGRGAARLMNNKGEILKSFESDCGQGWVYNFQVGPKPDSINTNLLEIGLYPTRTNDKTILDYYANKRQDVLVKLVTDADAKVVEEHKYIQLKEGKFTYDLSRFPKGRFYLKVFINGQEKFNKRIRLKE